MATLDLNDVANKLYQCRAVLRGICGSTYAARIASFMELVERVGETQGGVMQAGIALAKELQNSGEDVSIMWIMAATVELLEPDALTPARDW